MPRIDELRDFAVERFAGRLFELNIVKNEKLGFGAKERLICNSKTA